MKDSYKAAVGIVARKAITTSHGPRFRSPAFVNSPARASVITKKVRTSVLCLIQKNWYFILYNSAAPHGRWIDPWTAGSTAVAELLSVYLPRLWFSWRFSIQTLVKAAFFMRPKFRKLYREWPRWHSAALSCLGSKVLQFPSCVLKELYGKV